MSGDVVYLDKDGTIIEDLPYNVDPERIRFAPGAVAGLRRLASADLGVAVITNQSGVARGLFGLDDLAVVARFLARRLEAEGVPLLGFYACPHLPDGINEFAIECDCRKPRSGLIHRAERELGRGGGDRWMVGDTWMDVAAGQGAGCRTILLDASGSRLRDAPAGVRPEHVVADLDRAAEIITGARGRATPARPRAGPAAASRT